MTRSRPAEKVSRQPIYTRRGDTGTTGLLFGGRVRKDADRPTAYGTVDEAQAALGLARAETAPGSSANDLLVRLQRDLWVVMAELATDPARRAKLVPAVSLVTDEMVFALEKDIDELSASIDPPTEFVVPGQTKISAALDYARTVVRRAERTALAVAVDDSLVVPYLNRLSDLVWTMARWQEDDHLPTRVDTPGATAER